MSQGLFIGITVAYTVSVPLILLAWKIWDWRVLWQSGFHRLILTDEDKVIHSLLVKIPLGAETVRVKISNQYHTLGLDTDAVRYLGRFRIPTYEYIIGRAEPLLVGEMDDEEKQERIERGNAADQLREDRTADKEGRDAAVIPPLVIEEDVIVAFSERVGSVDFDNVAENKAMTQLIETFRKGLFNPGNLMIIGFVIVVIVVLIVGGYQISQTNTIMDAQGLR